MNNKNEQTLEFQIQNQIKENQNKFAIDYTNWINENLYTYNRKFKLYQKSNINETLFYKNEELIIKFNKKLEEEL
jgi:hypothetical protein